MHVDYDKLAERYANYRIPDPRIAARIHTYLQGAHSVLNLGAGMGSYEPEDVKVVAIEPSYKMIARRRRAKATLIQGVAENLPFRDNGFEASMAILSLHHWSDLALGLKEMCRVSKEKIVLFTWIGYGSHFWLEEYIPEIRNIDEKRVPTLAELDHLLGGISVETIKIPHDCTDGFMCAYWRRPEVYLDPDARKAISTFSYISDFHEGLSRLRDDINSGVWQRRQRHLLEKKSIDLGYRLVVWER